MGLHIEPLLLITIIFLGNIINAESTPVEIQNIQNKTLRFSLEKYNISFIDHDGNNQITKEGIPITTFTLEAKCGAPEWRKPRVCDLRETYCDPDANYRCMSCANLCSPARISAKQTEENVRETCEKQCPVYLYIQARNMKLLEQSSETDVPTEYINTNEYKILFFASISVIVILVILLGCTCRTLLWLKSRSPEPLSRKDVLLGRSPKQAGYNPIKKDGDQLLDGVKKDEDHVNKDEKDDIKGEDPTLQIIIDKDMVPDTVNDHTTPPPTPKPTEETNGGRNNLVCEEQSPANNLNDTVVKTRVLQQSSTEREPELPGEGLVRPPHDPLHGRPTLERRVETAKWEKHPSRINQCPLSSATVSGTARHPDDIMQHTNDTGSPESGLGTYSDMKNLQSNLEKLQQVNTSACAN